MCNVYYALGIEIGYDDDDEEECTSVRCTCHTHFLHFAAHFRHLFNYSIPQRDFFHLLTTNGFNTNMHQWNIHNSHRYAIFPSHITFHMATNFGLFCMELQINPVSLVTASDLNSGLDEIKTKKNVFVST